MGPGIRKIVPKAEGMRNFDTVGHADEVEFAKSAWEIVVKDESDAAGMADVLEKLVADGTLRVENIWFAADETGVRWLVHAECCDDFSAGFVSGLMTGWRQAAEGG